VTRARNTNTARGAVTVAVACAWCGVEVRPAHLARDGADLMHKRCYEERHGLDTFRAPAQYRPGDGPWAHDEWWGGWNAPARPRTWHEYNASLGTRDPTLALARSRRERERERASPAALQRDPDEPVSPHVCLYCKIRPRAFPVPAGVDARSVAPAWSMCAAPIRPGYERLVDLKLARGEVVPLDYYEREPCLARYLAEQRAKRGAALNARRDLHDRHELRTTRRFDAEREAEEALAGRSLTSERKPRDYWRGIGRHGRRREHDPLV